MCRMPGEPLIAVFVDFENLAIGAQVTKSGRFQIDTVIPVSGVGVVVGSADGGDSLRDAVSDAASIESRLKYL